jgi:NAD+ kinase
MARATEKLSFISSNAPDAQAARLELEALYGAHAPEDADVIIALGGDGFMLQTLHRMMNSNKVLYGMNRGSIGFLMNEYATDGLRDRIERAVESEINPLEMVATDEDGAETHAFAINEVSVLRQSYQAAKLRVSVDGKVRLEELVCDGLMVATPAGSTAYNLSAHGPILPLVAPLLALTPVSAFRPRRWRGALLSNKAEVTIEVLEREKRPVNAVADNTEVKSIRLVRIVQSKQTTARLLSDPDHSWDDRILAEQFLYGCDLRYGFPRIAFIALGPRQSERDFVVHVAGEIVVARCRRLSVVVVAATAPARIIGAAATTAAATLPHATALAASVEHGQCRVEPLQNDLGGVFVLAALILPFAGLELALDIHLGALLQVAFRNLAQALIENDDAVPLGLLLAFAGVTIAPGFRSRNGQIGNRAAVLCATDFRVGTQISDENDLVDASCHGDCLLVVAG